MQWKVWLGWSAIAVGAAAMSVVTAAGRTDCGGWGFGCDPAFVAMMWLYFLGPPLVAAGIAVAGVSKWAGRRAAVWVAALAPPVIALVFWSWVGVV